MFVFNFHLSKKKKKTFMFGVRFRKVLFHVHDQIRTVLFYVRRAHELQWSQAGVHSRTVGGDRTQIEGDGAIRLQNLGTGVLVCLLGGKKKWQKEKSGMHARKSLCFQQRRCVHYDKWCAPLEIPIKMALTHICLDILKLAEDQVNFQEVIVHCYVMY